MQTLIWLITDSPSNAWAKRLQEQMAGFAPITVLGLGAMPKQDLPEPRLILLDATAFVEFEDVVASLQKQVPKTPIVILTASPTWRRARTAFEAGVADYLSKDMPIGELTEKLKKLLLSQSPSSDDLGERS